jgi:hypothetical protein
MKTVFTSLHRWGRCIVAASVVSTTVLLGACAVGPEAARFENKPRVETYPVTIVAVDGATVTAATSAVLEPGKRRVTVQLPRAAGFKDGEHQTIDLDVRSCTRYWLVGSRTAGTEAMNVVVDHSQVVHSCLARATR